MAIGGALRAAIRAGRFGVAARESRQRARALRSLNATGGISNASLSRQRGKGFLPKGEAPYFDDYEGVDPRRGLDWSDFGPGTVGEGISATGSFVEENPFLYGYGGRILNPPPLRPSLIDSPFEGFRVLPEGTAATLDNYGVMPGFRSQGWGPWQGRGKAPVWEWEPGGLRGGGGVMDDIQHPGWRPGLEFRGPGVSRWEEMQREMAPFGIEVPDWVRANPYYSPY